MAARKQQKKARKTAPRERVLTMREDRFTDEFLIDLNGTQAAIRAGYSRKTAYSQASRLLRNVYVQRVIEAKKAERAKRVQLSQDDVLRQLRSILTFDPRRAYDPETGRQLGIHELPEDVAMVVSGIDSEELFDNPDGEGKVAVGEVRKLKFWDKPKMIELAMKHLGMITEKVDHRVKHSQLSYEQMVLESMKAPAQEAAPTVSGESAASNGPAGSSGGVTSSEQPSPPSSPGGAA